MSPAWVADLRQIILYMCEASFWIQRPHNVLRKRFVLINPFDRRNGQWPLHPILISEVALSKCLVG